MILVYCKTSATGYDCGLMLCVESSIAHFELIVGTANTSSFWQELVKCLVLSFSPKTLSNMVMSLAVYRLNVTEKLYR